MDVAWTCANNESLTFSASAILWPSSTKAEMLACLTALIVASAKAHVTIFTDSVITISDMANLRMMIQLLVRKREKIPNFPIWVTIRHVLDIMDLTITIVKVKAHSGDRLNDRTDQLAKTAAISASRLNVTI